MANLEISTAKVWSMFKEEIRETASGDTADKLMRLALNTAKDWDEYAVDVNTLKRMQKFCEKRLADLENEY